MYMNVSCEFSLTETRNINQRQHHYTRDINVLIKDTLIEDYQSFSLELRETRFLMDLFVITLNNVQKNSLCNLWILKKDSWMGDHMLDGTVAYFVTLMISLHENFSASLIRIFQSNSRYLSRRTSRDFLLSTQWYGKYYFIYLGETLVYWAITKTLEDNQTRYFVSNHRIIFFYISVLFLRNK